MSDDRRSELVPQTKKILIEVKGKSQAGRAEISTEEKTRPTKSSQKDESPSWRLRLSVLPLAMAMATPMALAMVMMAMVLSS